MAQNNTAYRNVVVSLVRFAGLALGLGAALTFPAKAQMASVPAAASVGASSASSVAPAWIAIPRAAGRLTARDIGVVINTADPYSVEVGEFYIAARGLKPAQVLSIEVPVKHTLEAHEFERLAQSIRTRFGADIQALALAWRQPYRVSCNSITAALTMGFDPALCAQTCAPSRRSAYFNSPSARPFSDHGMRPSMLLAANDVAGAKAMIERGVAARHSLGLRGAPPAHVYFVTTSDRARSVRSANFPPAGPLPRVGIVVHTPVADAIENVDRVLLYQTGLAQVPKLDSIRWVPGALADHLTSYGGYLDGLDGQMTALEWIASGATASYGTVTEPCSHWQKFPQPQVLLQNYLGGATAIEAYWRSVAWPQQGLFIGEPLAAPFSR